MTEIETLYSLSFKEYFNTIPQKIQNDIKNKIINDNYNPNAKKVKFLLQIKSRELRENGLNNNIWYYLYYLVPELFKNCEIKKQETINTILLWFRDRITNKSDNIVVSHNDAFIYDKKINKLVDVEKMLKKNLWIDISQSLYEKLQSDENLKKYFIFADVMDDFNLIITRDILIISFSQSVLTNCSTYKISNYQYRYNNFNINRNKYIIFDI
jgi:hypothetical protein